MTSLLENEPNADVPLLGIQTPRILWAPPAPTSAADEAIELAASVGLYLDPWQRLVLHHALGERLDGKWSAFEVGLCVSRQNGKTAVIEARILAGLLLFGDELIVYSAHEFKTAVEIMRRLHQLLINSGEKFRPQKSHGQEGFELGDGRSPGPRVMFQSRTKAAGLGLSGDCIILDEAMWLAPEAIGVLMPTMASRPNPQIWYAGSPVDQEIHPKGYVFSGVRKRGVDGSSPRLCYMEWSCEDGANPRERRNWAQSNPSLGYRLTEEFIADELEAMKHTPKVFAVMRLGIGDWPTLAEAQEAVIPEAVWQGRCVLEPDLVGKCPQVIGVDRDPFSKVWSVAGAQRTQSGGVHVEVGYCDRFSVTEMAEKLIHLVALTDPDALVIDARSPAAILKPYLVKAGIDPVLTNAQELAMACEGLVEAVLAEQVTHSGQQILTDSVTSAGKRDLPGGRFAWDRPVGGSVVQVMAATLAHWGLLSFGALPKRSPPPLAGKRDVPMSDGREIDLMTVAF